MVIVIRSTITL